MTQHANVLEPDTTALLLIDVQERFRTALPDFEDMLAGCVRLARTFRTLDLPILITEQYPEGLGHIVDELNDILQLSGAPEKTAFSAYRCGEISEWLGPAGIRTVLVAGIETHVCVNQTVHDLLAEGYSAHVAVDAIASRKVSDRDIALRKIERSGGVITTTEMAAFELLGDATHLKFKEIQGIFKSR